MRIADATWQDVDSTTIRNCWQKAQILPEVHPSPLTPLTIPISTLIHNSTSQMDPITHVEKQVEFALNDLVLRGALHQQKGTWLQLPYYALLCLIELIRHNKAVVTRFLFANVVRTHDPVVVLTNYSNLQYYRHPQKISR